MTAPKEDDDGSGRGGGNQKLTPEQRHALFDILTHHETYTEIQGFKWADAVTSYGFPFTRTLAPGALGAGSGSGGGGGGASSAGGSLSVTPTTGTTPTTPRSRSPAPPAVTTEEDDPDNEEEYLPTSESTSPLLQTLLTRFVLSLPGIQNLPKQFWTVGVEGLLARLGGADLSESYDKGALGLRKTLATGASAIVEMVGRGALGGVARRKGGGGGQAADGNADKEKSKGSKVVVEEKEYDRANAEDLERAWEDVVQGYVWGNLSDEMFRHAMETDDLESYSPAIKAVAEYIVINIATFAHHIFILSPEGQYLLKLIENVHGLIPYKMVKQTLRVGNAATMISGMMRLLLAKLSVTSITNWVGLTQNADDGMNLLQRIISLVLSWDAAEFRKSAEKVEKAKDKPKDEVLQAIKGFVAEGREEHERVRAESEKEGISIVVAILRATKPELLDGDKGLDEKANTQCLEYYSALLSVHDREAITSAFCRQTPDLFTQTIKDAVGAYEPIIRKVHSNIDLREHLEATQGFIEDFIKTSKPKKASQGGGSQKVAEGVDGSVATVEDYVDLFMRNRHLLYKWVYHLASKCPDVWEQFHNWAQGGLPKFRKPESEDGKKTESARTMEDRLDELFSSSSASSENRKKLLASIDAHAEYLSTTAQISRARLQYLIMTAETSAGAMSGPGMYLSRWQDLLDDTPITPAKAEGGSVRTGRDVKHTVTMGKKNVVGGGGASSSGGELIDESARGRMLNDQGPKAPDVSIVVEELGDGFREIVREVGGRWRG